MSTIYYHEGPKGLNQLMPLGMLIENAIVSVEHACEAWAKKWGDWIEEDALLSHPTLNEISLTEDIEEAQWIAETIGGCVYTVDAEIFRINEEGYPVCLGPVACEAV